MHFFRTYLAILRRHWLTILAYALIFIVLAFITGSSHRGDGSSFERVKMSLAWTGEEADESGLEAFVSWLRDKGHQVSRLSVTEEEARELIFSLSYDAVLLPGGDGDKIRMIADQRSAAGQMAILAAESYFRYRQAVLDEGGKPRESDLNRILEEESPVVFLPAAEGEKGSSEILVAFLSSLAYILTLMSTTLIPLVNQSFDEAGVGARTHLSPYPLWPRTLGKFLGSALVVFGTSILLISATLPVSLSMFRGAPSGCLILNYFVFTLSVLALSYALSGFVKNKAAVRAVSTVLSLGVAFLSGAFVPQSMVGGTALTMAKAFPLYYFIHANRFSDSLAMMAPDLVIQGLFTLFYFLLAFLAAWLAKRSRKEPAL